eukprot:31526-Pelagococcus_subviridis.AAC.4
MLPRVSEGRGSIVQSDVGAEFIGVRSGVERRRGRESRSPRRRGRMGTSVNQNAPGGFTLRSTARTLGGVTPARTPPTRQPK